MGGSSREEDLVMMFFDALFDPMSRMALAGGPTKVRLFFSMAVAKCSFSDRNP